MFPDTGEQEAERAPDNESDDKCRQDSPDALWLNRDIGAVRFHEPFQIELLALCFAASIFQGGHGRGELLVGKLGIKLQARVASCFLRQGVLSAGDSARRDLDLLL